MKLQDSGSLSTCSAYAHVENAEMNGDICLMGGEKEIFSFFI